jgi:hypothetical protein
MKDDPPFTWVFLDNAMASLVRPLYTWPTWLRHTYLCLLPLSFVLRLLAGSILVICICLHYIWWSSSHWIGQVWRGERPTGI